MSTGWKAGTARTRWLCAGQVRRSAREAGGLEVSGRNVQHGAGQLARGRIVFRADGLDLVKLVERGRAGNALGEDADGGFVLPSLARSGVAADDVVIQHGFQVPALGLGQLRQVGAAIQPLLLAGDGDEDEAGGELDAALRSARGRTPARRRLRWRRRWRRARGRAYSSRRCCASRSGR